ncbi:MAG: hypothetical protein R6U98_36670 [Pirellulaceae bacterium]
MILHEAGEHRGGVLLTGNFMFQLERHPFTFDPPYGDVVLSEAVSKFFRSDAGADLCMVHTIRFPALQDTTLPRRLVADNEATEGIFGTHGRNLLPRKVELGLHGAIIIGSDHSAPKSDESGFARRSHSDNPTTNRRHQAASYFTDNLVKAFTKIVHMYHIGGRSGQFASHFGRGHDTDENGILISVILHFVNRKTSQHHLDGLLQRLLTRGGDIRHFFLGQIDIQKRLANLL